jgi:hypothetical protein
VRFRLGDIVALRREAMGPRLRGGACTPEELSVLTVVALKNRGRAIKLTTRTTGIGWELAKNVLFVRRGEG